MTIIAPGRDPDRERRALRRLTRRATIGFVVTAAWVPLAAFGLTAGDPPAAWVPWAVAAVIAMASATLYAWTLSALGYRARALDETERVVGEWTMRSVMPASGDPVTVTGHLVLTSRADIGRLGGTRIHVALDEDEEDSHVSPPPDRS